MSEPSSVPSSTAFDDGANGSPRAVYLRAALLFVAVALLYVFTRSPALDEMDSVQFAQGVVEFNLWKYYPHPPGYPLYIFPAWLATKLFTPDPVLWLQPSPPRERTLIGLALVSLYVSKAWPFAAIAFLAFVLRDRSSRPAGA